LKSILLSVVSILLALGSRLPAWAQLSRPDSTLLIAASSRLNQHYSSGLGNELGLYNGAEYLDYLRSNTEGNPFFAHDNAQPATLVYAGRTYTNVPLRYDLLRGQLVLAAPGSSRQIRLVNEQVARFTLSGHSFIRLVVDSSTSSPVRTGFYDVLVDGPVRLLAAHRKTRQESSRAEGMQREILARDDYFIAKDHRYYAVSKGAEVVRLFPQDKAALRQYIQNNNLNFNPEGREQALAALVRYQATLAAGAR
jgi:hypothetical protein